MGILDDAIREHLELKRKHGVPEDELERQEEEALGPARRDVAQQPEEVDTTAGATATAEAEHDEPSAASEEETALFDMEAPEAEAPAAVEDEEPVAEAPVEDQPPAGMEVPEPVEPDPEPDPEPEPSEPTPVEPPPVEPPADAAEAAPYLGDTEPHGFEAVEEDEDLDDDEATGDEGSEDEDQDVLEDTPDFLQETPEHDRLWFEQKPPRDFDFD